MNYSTALPLQNNAAVTILSLIHISREYARMAYEGMEGEGQANIVNLLRCAWAGSQKSVSYTHLYLRQDQNRSDRPCQPGGSHGGGYPLRRR